MHFMFWSSAQSGVDRLLHTWSQGAATASLAGMLALSLPLSAGAQSNPSALSTPSAVSSQTSSDSLVSSSTLSGPLAGGTANSASANALLVSQFAADGTAPMPATAGNPSSASVSTSGASSTAPIRSATKDDTTNDAVARFLADKGLLGSVALQVRDKAADMASDLVISAMDFLGVRYKSGGQSRDGGFDCSGFTRHVFERSIGMILPRRAAEQANMPGLMQVSENELKPGDLVFFNTLRHTFSHVGIYVGDNKFIHSPRSGGQVRIEDMGQSYWQKRFDGARRVPRLSKQQAELAQH